MRLHLISRFVSATAGIFLSVASVDRARAQAPAPSVVQPPSVTAAHAKTTQVKVLSSLDLTADATTQSLSKFKVRAITLPSAPEYSPQKNVTFEGYALEDVLSLLPKVAGDVQDKDLDVRFVANDGFIVTAHLDVLRNGKGVVAFRDVDAPAGEKWKTFLLGKKPVTPAPFFLVWGEGIRHETDNSFPWPFQLARVELIERDAVPEAVKPRSKDAKVVSGFAIYRSRCLVCHSVNLAGADVGPEMNVPKNVTEYRSRAYFDAFVRNPSSFRARSRMEGQKISKTELDQIWAYLSSMKAQKICASDSACKGLTPK